jgi:hypothetical protein
MADKRTAALVIFAEIIGLPLRYPQGCRLRPKKAIAGPPERQFSES